MPPDANQGWTEWSKYVLKELERLNVCFENLDSKVGQLRIDAAELKVRMGIIGAISGIVAGAVASVLVRLAGK